MAMAWLTYRKGHRIKKRRSYSLLRLQRTLQQSGASL